MSFQAITWVLHQKIAPPARKLLLFVLANYADKHGICWPSQSRLAEETGMSLDTVQRQTKKLCADGFLSIKRSPKRRGQWQTFVYQLHISDATTKPQSAARQKLPPHRVEGQLVEGDCGSAEPHQAGKPDRTAMRLNPSIEPSLEPSRARATEKLFRDEAVSACTKLPPPSCETVSCKLVSQPVAASERKTGTTSAAETLLAFQKKQEATEVTQNRIARRLGPDGWLIFGELSEADQERLTALERRRSLNDDTLQEATLRARLAQPP